MEPNVVEQLNALPARPPSGFPLTEKWIADWKRIVESDLRDLPPRLTERASFRGAATAMRKVQAQLAAIQGTPAADLTGVQVQALLNAHDEFMARLNEAFQETFNLSFDQWRHDILDELKRPSSLVISGGVSLGSYQGGFLHYYSQFLLAWRAFVTKTIGPQDLGRAELDALGGFRIATGASAGSINAFLAAIVGCQEPRPDPEKSLFFNTWVPVGMNELAQRGGNERSLFTRTPVNDAVARIKELWAGPPTAGGWSKGACRATLGMTVTRLAGRKIFLEGRGEWGGRVAVNRQSEKFLLAIESKGGGQAPTFRPFRPVWAHVPVREWPLMLYPVLGENALEVPIEQVMQLLRASSAFPVAFEPVPLRYSFWQLPPAVSDQPAAGARTRADDDADEAAITLSPAREDLFIDGGVFDNTPLLLAMRIDEWLEAEAARREASAGDAGGPAAAHTDRSKPRIIFVEPDAIGWQKRVPQEAAAVAKARSIFGDYLPFLSEFISTARGAELQHTIERDPTIARSLAIPPRLAPVASGQLLNFLGFYERSFRVFDFFLGMVDAWDYLRTQSPQFELMARAAGTVGMPRDPFLVESPTFECLRAARFEWSRGVDANAASLPACRALVNAAPAGSSRSRFDEVRAGNMLALLAASRDLKQWSQTDGYDPSLEDERFFAMLGRERFVFVDLPALTGSKVTANNALNTIRAQIQGDIQRLGKRQPGLGDEFAIATVGKAAANLFHYQMPRFTLGVGLVTARGAEVSAKLRLGWGPFAVGAGLRLQPFESDIADALTRSEINTFWARPYARLIVEVVGKPTWQLELGAGFAYATKREWAHPTQRLVSRYGPEASATGSLFQRFFLSYAMTYFLDDCATNVRCSEIETVIPIGTPRLGHAWTLGYRFMLP